jgi:predicted nucleotidyltransferase component of viral defense system
MLHRETIPASTLDLLIKLCAEPALQSFALAGGTALALRMGHRMSVDLDFFTAKPFATNEIADLLTETHEMIPTNINAAGLSGVIQGVKVDFVAYRYPLLQPFETLEGIRLFGIRDNIAMKLSVLTNRGAKKDFFDAHRLIHELGLPHLVSIYQEKYPHHDAAILLRSLLYFEDAEADFDPVSLNNTTWEDVKESIIRAVRTML